MADEVFEERSVRFLIARFCEIDVAGEADRDGVNDGRQLLRSECTEVAFC